MPRRPLLPIAALSVGDYLVWIWSSAHGAQTVALVSGLLLPVLLLALVWLLVRTVVRMVARQIGAVRRAPLATTSPAPAAGERKRPGRAPRRRSGALLPGLARGGPWRSRRNHAGAGVPVHAGRGASRSGARRGVGLPAAVRPGRWAERRLWRRASGRSGRLAGQERERASTSEKMAA